MYVCMYVRTHARLHIRMHVCMYVPFSAIIQFLFSRTSKCPGSYSWGYA